MLLFYCNVVSDRQLTGLTRHPSCPAFCGLGAGSTRLGCDPGAGWARAAPRGGPSKLTGYLAQFLSAMSHFSVAVGQSL